MKVIISTLLLLVLLSSFAYAETVQSLDYAKDLYRHNLMDKAKEMMINVLYDSKSTDPDKTESLYWLGQISFEEGRYITAFDDWNKLVKLYPQSSQAKEISERLKQLQEITAKISDAEITSVVARSYINNGDFWSKSDNIFTIDASWLPNVEMATHWYDKVIEEFPNSNASEIAFQRKLFTLLGWTEPGQYVESYGIQNNFEKYMPQILETFGKFIKSFPDSSLIQGFRYQIAQVYWKNKGWSEARMWLQQIIDNSGNKQTFYTETAKARLKKIEY